MYTTSSRDDTTSFRDTFCRESYLCHESITLFHGSTITYSANQQAAADETNMPHRSCWARPIIIRHQVLLTGNIHYTVH
jgi:hypothetical protein